MKRAKTKTTIAGQTPDARNAVTVEIPAHALRSVRQHARSSMDAEICGVFIGELKPDRTVVENVIVGERARQAGTHVTFTQETWAHVYELKDAKYPDKRIVGWYHSHPSFGIFLSEHDLFIHKNFFSDPQQIAWVFDPHSDEEGCFVWQGEEITRLKRLLITDSENQSILEARVDSWRSSDMEERSISNASRGPVWRPRLADITKWTTLSLSHLAALFFGALLALMLFRVEVIVAPPDSKHSAVHPMQQPAPREAGHPIQHTTPQKEIAK
jgi:proteasome lid subunit RPN8/RPN11